MTTIFQIENHQIFYKPQFQSIDKHFQSIDKRLDSIDSRLDHLEEFAEVTRNGVNVLIEWTEDVSNKLR